jgi:dihydropteroate synthase
MVKDTIFCKKKSLRFRDKIFYIEQPIVMGIVNITHDSFYSESRVQNIEAFLITVKKMLDEGATIIDIGAASSRPGAEIITSEEELNRLKPYLEVLKKTFPDVWFSIDTYNSYTASVCVEKYGFYMINDISAGSIDNNMFDTVIRLNVPYVLMHMKGIPKNMQQLANYEDVVGDVIQFLGVKKHELISNGLNDIIIDPGFGFGKTVDQNFKLLKNLDCFKILNCPILVGLSRKSLIYKTLQITPDESLLGSNVLHALALLNNADIIRTHDVKETLQTIKLIDAYKKA